MREWFAKMYQSLCCSFTKKPGISSTSPTVSVCFVVVVEMPTTSQHQITYHWKTVLIYLQAVLLTLRHPIMPSHLRHLWPIWPSLCSPINPPSWPITAHAHLAGPAGRAAGPGLPGLPSIQSSWKSHLPILLLSKTIKTQKIYNKSVSGSIWEKKKGAQLRKRLFENSTQCSFFSRLEK